MSDKDRGGADRETADKLDRAGEDPAAESGAGYGSHAPDAEPDKRDNGQTADSPAHAPSSA